uniref:Uncharacterized protein n=1 Tax=Pseudonaja textilis TaxID=8673 RepID=A0A670ZKV5_PSETE
MSLNSYTQQVPSCLPQFLGPERFLCNSSSLREFPSGFPSETKSIFVDSTQISNLAADALQGLPELQELYLFDNQLKTLPSGLFHNLPALQSLDFSRNLLEDLPADLFAPVTSLASLSLSANQLTELRPSWFVTLKELKNLRLDHNQLKEIPPNCFRTLTLVSLDLSSNLLRCLSPEMFQGLTFLEMLNLINNPIVGLDFSSQNSLASMGKLQLPEFPSQNVRTSIPTIPQSAMDGCELPTAALGPSGICSPPIFQAAQLRNTLS